MVQRPANGRVSITSSPMSRTPSRGGGSPRSGRPCGPRGAARPRVPARPSERLPAGGEVALPRLGLARHLVLGPGEPLLVLVAPPGQRLGGAALLVLAPPALLL